VTDVPPATVAPLSSAMRALLEAHDTAIASRAELRLVIPPGTVLRALQITGLDRQLRIYPGLDAALTGRPHWHRDPCPADGPRDAGPIVRSRDRAQIRGSEHHEHRGSAR
jgi:hypothetical protein